MGPMRMRELLEAQILELEALQSVYPKELTIADYGNLADINEYISENCHHPPQRLEYSMNLTICKCIIELQVNLPLEYPEKRPEVYARSVSLDRTQQARINEALNKFVEIQEMNEPCIYSLITWIHENVCYYLSEPKYVIKEKCIAVEKKVDEKNVIFSRYWIYSHHIYSKLKRKEIMDEAKENSLTGFCLVGKPGIICVEGLKDDCEYWWQKIKVLNWHKIAIKSMDEDDSYQTDLETFRKFSEFEEISFPTLNKHNDMGQFRKYLMEYRFEDTFNELFGVERKNTAQ